MRVEVSVYLLQEKDLLRCNTCLQDDSGSGLNTYAYVVKLGIDISLACELYAHAIAIKLSII